MKTTIDLSKLQDVEAIFCDIDGTLISRKSILSERTIQAVKSLDIPFFLVSGRNYKGMEDFYTRLGLNTFRLTVNANVILDDKKIYYRGPYISGELLKDIISPLLKKYKDSISVEGYDDRYWYCNTLDNEFIRYEVSVLKFEPDYIFKSADEIQDKKLAKILVIAPKDIAKEIVKEVSAVSSSIQVILNHETYIEIYMNGTDKGTGVSKAINLLSLDKDKCIGIGDSAVDVSLLQAVGIKAAIGNADKCVKDVSNLVLDDCDNDGVAKLIEQLMKNRKGVK